MKLLLQNQPWKSKMLQKIQVLFHWVHIEECKVGPSHRICLHYHNELARSRLLLVVRYWRVIHYDASRPGINLGRSQFGAWRALGLHRKQSGFLLLTASICRDFRWFTQLYFPVFPKIFCQLNGFLTLTYVFFPTPVRGFGDRCSW